MGQMSCSTLKLVRLEFEWDNVVNIATSRKRWSQSSSSYYQIQFDLWHSLTLENCFEFGSSKMTFAFLKMFFNFADLGPVE